MLQTRCPRDSTAKGIAIAAGFVVLAGLLKSKRLEGPWRATYVVGAVMALYFNFFVLIVQTLQKVPALAALAPTQSAPPFAITQLVVLVAFLVVGYLAVVRFRLKAGAAAQQFL